MSTQKVSDPDFDEIWKADKKIDDDLDDIHKKIAGIKSIAIAQGEELNKQDDILNKTEKMTRVVDIEIQYTNRSIDKLMKKGKTNMCCYIVLFLIVILIIGIIATLILSR